jgi:UDP-N-acetylmuramyl pentapeptide phosphotransferase/UDP-N-acetylglucosamine-1-phosphate transferase
MGDGGSLFVDTNGADPDAINGHAGTFGGVIFRYNASEPLAATGGALPTTFAALASVAIIAAGIGFRPFNRRRSRASR